VDFRHISVYAVETCELFLFGVFRTDVNDDWQYRTGRSFDASLAHADKSLLSVVLHE